MQALLFVYNGDGTVIGQLSDAAHKALAPKTYQCNLCRVTYGLVRMKRSWRQFLQTLPVRVMFAHRDDFRRDHPEHQTTDLPAVFSVQKGDRLEPLITSAELSEPSSVDELADLVRERVEAASSGPAPSGNSNPLDHA